MESIMSVTRGLTRTSPTPTPAPAWLRELATARASYQELLGWPVSMQISQRNLVVEVGPALLAATMPAGLGARVRAQLGMSFVSAPIIANRDGTRWTFLAAPGHAERPPEAEELLATGVNFAPRGSYVVIPTSLSMASGRVERWIDCPHPNKALPPVCDIGALARRLTYPRRLDLSA
jgi:hypothetical protein